MAEEKKLNIVEKANKVLTFRKYIREECRKKGMEYPSDDKIAEYITSGYGMELDDFMKDYMEKEGIFREPIVDFIKEINKINWGENKPTEDEIRAFVTNNGYDLDKFVQSRVIASYNPLERAVLNSVLESCTIPQLVALWNEFIEESAIYGEDSYIYDVTDAEDIKFLRTHMTPAEFYQIQQIAKNNNTPFVQWFSLNDGDMRAKTDIKGIIIAYWSDIFPRLITWHSCYDTIGHKDTNQRFDNFFDIVVWPIFCEKLGYKFDPYHGSLEEIKR